MYRPFIFLVLNLLLFQSYAQDQFSGKVVEVLDGNTLLVIDNYQDTISVILKSIDCPQLNQEMGETAKVFTEKKCLGLNVGIILFGKDRFGNDVASVTIKDGDLSKSLLEAGLAWFSQRNKGDIVLAAIEESSRSKKIGIWENEHPIEPWVFRRQQSMLTPKLSY